ncbi:hypothetical protein LCGC14_2819240, partial [marine sediment metagenome]
PIKLHIFIFDFLLDSPQNAAYKKGAASPNAARN